MKQSICAGAKMLLPVTVENIMGNNATVKWTPVDPWSHTSFGLPKPDTACVPADSLIFPESAQTNSIKAYHAVLNAFVNFDNAMRKTVWGCESVEEALAIPSEEFMQMYQSIPDTGSVWVSTDERLPQTMLVLYCRDAKVHCVNIGSHHYSIERIGYNEFVKNFSPNGDTCESLPVILKEVTNVENVLSLFKEMIAAKNNAS